MINRYLSLFLLYALILMHLVIAVPVAAQSETATLQTIHGTSGPTPNLVTSGTISSSVVTVSPLKAENNASLKRVLISKNIDLKDVTLEHDYGVISDNIAVYKHKDTGEHYAVIEQAPMVNPDSTAINCQWVYQQGVYSSPGNTFRASVHPNGLTIVTLPYGNYSGAVKPGASMMYNPQVFLGEKEMPIISGPYVLPVDPVNSYYTDNCLIFDYGFCTRRIRQIEGQLLTRWIFTEVPPASVRIEYNQSGAFGLDLSNTFSLDSDTEVITPQDVIDQADMLGWPVVLDDTLTVYPDGNPETTSVDGFLYLNSYNSPFSNLRSAAAAQSVDDSGIGASILIGSRVSNPNWMMLRRGAFLFDTSALTNSAIISAATLSVNGSWKQDGISLSNFAANIYTFAPASNTSLATGDFDAFGSTALCDSDISYSSWNTSDYNDFALNATGLAAISKTGITKFGICESYYDVGGNTPPHPGVEDSTGIGWHCTEQGVGYGPKLVITYTILSPPTVETLCSVINSGVSADLYGNVTAVGTSGTVTARGFYYGTSGTPTISDNNVYEKGAFNTGTYSLPATGLISATAYYVRAYAVTASGTGYGSVYPFSTTLQSTPSDTTAHPYYVRVTAHNESAGTITNRILATINADALVDYGYCQADGTDLIATQSSVGIPLTATEMDGASSTWIMPHETFTANQEKINLIWMGTDSGTRNQTWLADDGDIVYADDVASLDASGTVSITAFLTTTGTPSDILPIVEKPGNYRLAVTSTPTYSFTIWQGSGSPVSGGTKTVFANGAVTGIESVSGASTHWEAVSTANDSTYVYDSRKTTGHYDLYEISSTIPEGSVITSVTVWYRVKIEGDCAGYPPSRAMPIIYSQATGLLSGTPTYWTNAMFVTGSHTFAYTGSSDLQIGIDLHSDINCSTPTMCSRLWANVDYTPPGSSETVSITATIDEPAALHAVYDGSELSIHNLLDCDSDSLAISGTMHVSSDPLYIAMFNGEIDEISGRSNSGAMFEYSFEPDEISGDTIEDLSGQNNDLTFTLASMDSNIDVSVDGVTIYIPTYYGVDLVSSGSPSFIPVYVPDEPADITGDDDSYDRFPGAGLVNDMLSSASIPRSAFWLCAFFGLIMGLCFVTFRKTRDILGMMICCIAILVIQAVTRMGIGYLDIVMLLVCFSALYFRREYSRGQLS